MGKALDTTQIKSSAALIGALLDCYDDIQNLQHLVRGVRLAVEDVEDLDEAERRWALAEIVKCAEDRLADIKKRIEDANSEDVANTIAVERRARGGTNA